jgi:hypothetical protein
MNTATAAQTDLNADSSITLAEAVKAKLDTVLRSADLALGGFSVSIDLMGDGKVPHMNVTVGAYATPDTLINAAGIMARRVCAAHTYEGRTIFPQCVAGKRYTRYF